jgi:hypothetical protein
MQGLSAPALDSVPKHPDSKLYSLKWREDGLWSGVREAVETEETGSCNCFATRSAWMRMGQEHLTTGTNNLSAMGLTVTPERRMGQGQLTTSGKLVCSGVASVE